MQTAGTLCKFDVHPPPGRHGDLGVVLDVEPNELRILFEHVVRLQ